MATTTVTMLAPTTSGQYVPRSGTVYSPDVLGLIYNVPIAGNDIKDLMFDGCVIVTSGNNNGTPGTGVTAAEYGNGFTHTTVLTLGALAVLPAIAGGASLGVGVLLYTFPAGSQIIKAARMAVGITQTQGHINADTPTVGLGTTIASGAVAVLSGTAGFQNVAVGKAAANCTGTATVQTALATASPFGLVTETGGTKTLYFNAAFAWAASGDAAAALSGTVSLDWQTMA